MSVIQTSLSEAMHSLLGSIGVALQQTPDGRDASLCTAQVILRHAALALPTYDVGRDMFVSVCKMLNTETEDIMPAYRRDVAERARYICSILPASTHEFTLGMASKQLDAPLQRQFETGFTNTLYHNPPPALIATAEHMAQALYTDMEAWISLGHGFNLWSVCQHQLRGSGQFAYADYVPFYHEILERDPLSENDGGSSTQRYQDVVRSLLLHENFAKEIPTGLWLVCSFHLVNRLTRAVEKQEMAFYGDLQGRYRERYADLEERQGWREAWYHSWTRNRNAFTRSVATNLSVWGEEPPEPIQEKTTLDHFMGITLTGMPSIEGPHRRVARTAASHHKLNIASMYQIDTGVESLDRGVPYCSGPGGTIALLFTAMERARIMEKPSCDVAWVVMWGVLATGYNGGHCMSEVLASAAGIANEFRRKLPWENPDAFPLAFVPDVQNIVWNSNRFLAHFVHNPHVQAAIAAGWQRVDETGML